MGVCAVGFIAMIVLSLGGSKNTHRARTLADLLIEESGNKDFEEHVHAWMDEGGHSTGAILSLFVYLVMFASGGAVAIVLIFMFGEATPLHRMLNGDKAQCLQVVVNSFYKRRCGHALRRWSRNVASQLLAQQQEACAMQVSLLMRQRNRLIQTNVEQSEAHARAALSHVLVTYQRLRNNVIKQTLMSWRLAVRPVRGVWAPASEGADDYRSSRASVQRRLRATASKQERKPLRVAFMQWSLSAKLMTMRLECQGMLQNRKQQFRAQATVMSTKSGGMLVKAILRYTYHAVMSKSMWQWRLYAESLRVKIETERMVSKSVRKVEKVSRLFIDLIDSLGKVSGLFIDSIDSLGKVGGLFIDSIDSLGKVSGFPGQ
jgi:hypothetical protein